ncbi:MAG: hypothetical protein PHS14_16020 [Elusimicrobia bacterium]|nr:hypothetical protein [Elusimicrobiota bacterium]
MDSKQAKDFIARYTGPNVRSFVKPSHLEELSPLLQVHIEAIEVRKDEFHEMEGGKAYMPRKETLDKFAAAAGVSYNEAAESTRKEGEGCYVGRSQAMVMGPDGKMIFGSACEYEFDIDTRTEEMQLDGKKDWAGVPQGGRPNIREYTEKELSRERVNFRKVGRQRANTGARNRATVSILGMPTGIRGLFDKNDPLTATRTFLFSRIIINAKNELVMNKMLDGLASNTAALYGPSATAQIAAPAHARAPDPADYARPAEDQTTSAGDDELDFGGAAPAAKADQAEAARNALRDYINSGVLSKQQIDVVQPAVDNPATPLGGPGSLMYYLDLCKKQEEARKRRAS